jgi:hypothetical protein
MRPWYYPNEMKTTRALAATGLLITLTVILQTGRSASGAAEATTSDAAAPGGPSAVVVELFTSEGCSSCPPADKVLSWLAGSQPVPGVEIIPLSEHVDYWNHLGWADPYSSPGFTERQRDYSGRLHTGAYTPQMVVDGKVQFVGGDADAALSAIRSEARQPRAEVRIHPVDPKGASMDRKVSFSVEVDRIPIRDPKKKSLVFLAVTENNLRSSVVGGENSGRVLAHTAVVRELKQIGQLETRPEAAFHARPQIEISREWKRADLRAVVFLQLQGHRGILGAAVARFPGD